MNGFFFVTGCILSFLICVFWFSRINIVRCSVLSIFLYFCYYSIIGGVLFSIDMFSVEKTVVLIVILEGILLLKVSWKKKPDLEWLIRPYIFPIILAFCAVPFVGHKFGFYGMGQDEGVYQTQAIAFMNHHYENQKDFLEYESLEEEEKEYFRQFVDSKLVGYYVYDESLPSLSPDNKKSDVSGFYHGLPVFSAMLALWGMLFGIKYMAGIQTVFYICGLFLMYFTCENLQLKKFSKYGSVFLYVCSPILVWVAKSSLTEIFLVCIIAGFLYFMTGKGGNVEIGYAALMVAVFSFYHLTIYTVLPVLILAFWSSFLFYRKNSYLYAAIVVFLVFIFSMFSAVNIAATYCYVYNFVPLYKLTESISRDNIFLILVFCTGLGILLSLLLLLSPKEKTFSLTKTEHVYNACIRLGILGFGFLQWRIIRELLMNGADTWMEAVLNTTIFGYFLYGGGVLLLFAVIWIFWKPSVCWKNIHVILLMEMFGYCVMFYACFLRKSISHYYYGRYLAPFISIVILVISIVVNEWRTKYGTVMFGILLVSYAMMCMPYNLILAENDDDTRMSWDIMMDIAEVIPDDSTVYMDYDLGMILYLPMRELLGQSVYPVRSHELQEKIGNGSQEQSIYYISEMYQYLPMCDMIYGNWYETSEDKNGFHGSWIPLPLGMEKERKHIAVYEVRKFRDQFRFADGNVMLSGYYGLESDFRWSDPQNNIVQCVLHKGDYIVRVIQGSTLPLETLGLDTYEVKLKINGDYADSCIITKDSVESELVFRIPASLVQEGENTISFQCEPWSPQSFGVSDNRTLGIAVQQIIFENDQN